MDDNELIWEQYEQSHELAQVYYKLEQRLNGMKQPYLLLTIYREDQEPEVHVSRQAANLYPKIPEGAIRFRGEAIPTKYVSLDKFK